MSAPKTAYTRRCCSIRLRPANAGRGDDGAEVIAAAVEVDDLGASARDRRLDALLELVRSSASGVA
jgi:hypothetical protein